MGMVLCGSLCILVMVLISMCYKLLVAFGEMRKVVMWLISLLRLWVLLVALICVFICCGSSGVMCYVVSAVCLMLKLGLMVLSFFINSLVRWTGSCEARAVLMWMICGVPLARWNIRLSFCVFFCVFFKFRYRL